MIASIDHVPAGAEVGLDLRTAEAPTFGNLRSHAPTQAAMAPRGHDATAPVQNRAARVWPSTATRSSVMRPTNMKLCPPRDQAR